MCMLDCLLVSAIMFYMYKAKIWMGVVTSLQRAAWLAERWPLDIVREGTFLSSSFSEARVLAGGRWAVPSRRRSTPCRHRYPTTAEHVAVLVVSSPPSDTARFRPVRRVRQLLIGDAAVAASGRWLPPGAVPYRNAVDDSSASASSDRCLSLHSPRGAGVPSPARRSAELAISRQEHGHARVAGTPLTRRRRVGYVHCRRCCCPVSHQKRPPFLE